VRQKTPADRLGLKAHRRALGFRKTCAPPPGAVLALCAASGDGRPMGWGMRIWTAFAYTREPPRRNRKVRSVPESKRRRHDRRRL